jgi:predicted nuclease of predicted toxin-antitoxin system
MPKFLADENVPGDAVSAARSAGHDLAWIRELSPGAHDDAVRDKSLAEGRVLVTFDKGFGEMAFRHGKSASCGVVLLRPRLRSPDYLARFLVAVLAQTVTWEGNFAVAREGKLRVVPLAD